MHGLLAHAVAGGADPTRPGIVHRLDRDTCGLLVVARSERAHRRLQRLLRDRAIERRYLALVHGAAPAGADGRPARSAATAACARGMSIDPTEGRPRR